MCFAGKNEIKPRYRELFSEINTGLRSWRKSTAATLLNDFFFKTSLYQAVFAAGQPRILKGSHPGIFSKTIKIITANLILFPAPFFSDQKERIKMFTNNIKPYSADIILLQEVWDNNSLVDLCLAFPDYWASFVPSAIYNASGLLILSRFKITKAGFRRFPLSLRHNLEELLACKGILQVELENGPSTFKVFNTHLYSSPRRSKYRPNLRQFVSLQKHAKTATDSFSIIGGDLNLRPGEVDRLVSQKLILGTCRKPTAGSRHRNKKLDYIVLLPGQVGKFSFTTLRLEGSEGYSDHSPVLANILPLKKCP